MTDIIEYEEPIDGEIVNAPLTEEEKAEHDSRLARILSTFEEIGYKSLEIWRDLQWIKVNRTYRDQYDTWQEFCLAELGKDNSYIYRLLKDAEFKEMLLLEAATDEERLSIMSLKESNTRFIRGLPEDVQAAFWKLTYSLGSEMLSKKDNGAIEPTTSYMEALAENMNEILETGGLHIDGQFVSVDSVVASAKVEGVDEATAKAILLKAGVSEAAYEALCRQAEHIKEKSAKYDATTLKGNISTLVDVNGSSYPVLTDSKGNQYDMSDILLSFNNRFVTISIKSPIRDTSDL
jgi:hypothetical protein